MIRILRVLVYTFFSSLLGILVSNQAVAFEDTDVLPRGVRSFLWKQGLVNNISEKYGDNSNLYSVGGRYSKNFNAELISKLHPQGEELVEVLNKTLLEGYDLGSKIQLGELHFSGTASLEYMAPIFAYGLSDKWTLALALPFSRMDADIKVSSGGTNNIKQIYNAASKKHALDPQLKQAAETMANIDLAKEFERFMEQKRYKPLRSSDSWQLADVQLVSKYRYYESDRWVLLNKLTLNFPTGEEDDPNDFLDAPVFHRSFVEITQVQDYIVNGKTRLGSAIGYIWNLPDSISKRVPTSAEDYLPDPDRTERLDRDIGDAVKWELNLRHTLNSSFAVAIAYNGQYKVADYFSGSRTYDYSLLARETEAYFHRYELQGSYNTIQSYFNKKAILPLSLSYRYSDIFDGRNVERQQTHELTMAVFF